MGIVAWFTDPANWTGPEGIPARTIAHLVIAAASMLLAAVVALPLGVWLGHTRRAAFLATSVGNLGRAVPTLALLVILAAIPAIGVGDLAAILALALFAVAPMLTSTYVGVRDVDPEVRDAATGMGLTGRQVLRRVEMPLAMPSILSGIRTSTVQVVATVALAALVGSGGLGRYVVDGFARADTTMVVCGALLVSALALITDGLSGWLVRIAAPRGLAAGGEAPQSTGALTVARVPGSRGRIHAGAVGIWAGAYGIGAVALAGALTMAAGPSQAGQVTIAAFNFGESKILSELYAGVLREAGMEVRISELSSREVIAPALGAGEVDLVPEYLGTFTEFLNKQVNGPDAPAVASSDVAKTLAAGRGLAGPLGITLAEPAPAADQNAFAVTAQFAQEHNLASVSDLAAYSQERPVVLGGPPECPTRPFCKPGLESTYGMRIDSFVPLDAGGPLTKQAIVQGKVDLGLVFSSDGGVADNNLFVLADDKGLQTADNIVPALSRQAATPEVLAALNELSAVLTTEDLVAMNKAADIDRIDPEEVAAAFLAERGLVTPATVD